MLESIYTLSDSDIVKKISAKVKAMRLRQNITQTDLAEQTDLSLSTIKRMEDGEIKNFESLIRVMRILGNLDILAPLVEQEQLSPNEYYNLMVAKTAKPVRKRATKSHSKEAKEESEW